VAYFLEVGLLLMVLPWSAFWERNYFAQAWPELIPFITNHFVRGGVTGLGIVNLVVGFSELAPVFAARGSHDARSGVVRSSWPAQGNANRRAQNDEPHADVEP
jgi:hypothetical protein